MITGLIDTPIATSGVLDDFGEPKWAPAEFRRINDAAILCLDVGRSRIWQHGGDRPERLDLHNWWAGEPVRLHVILNHTDPAVITGGELSWQLVDEQGGVLAAGVAAFTRMLVPGVPGEVGVVEFTAPATPAARAATLAVQLVSDTVRCENQWPLWFYARPKFDPTATALYDPAQQLEAEWRAVATPCAAEDLARHAGPVITAAFDGAVRARLQAGGAVLLVQTGDGPLPNRRVPFWRESLKLLAPHPLWQRFPHRGFVELQFWGLATDVSFDTLRIDDLWPELAQRTPILRRLDAREFTMTDYLFDAQAGRWALDRLRAAPARRARAPSRRGCAGMWRGSICWGRFCGCWGGGRTHPSRDREGACHAYAERPSLTVGVRMGACQRRLTAIRMMEMTGQK